MDFNQKMKQHGWPHDRGGADYYYGRGFKPHYWPEGTYNGKMVPMEEMTADEIEAYRDGYEEAEESGVQKEW